MGFALRMNADKVEQLVVIARIHHYPPVWGEPDDQCILHLD
jgi:hypothetical protein